MPYQNSFTAIKKKLLQENWSSAFQQSINWIKFNKWKWQNYSRGRSNFQKNPHSGIYEVPEVSKLIDWLTQWRARDKETKGNAVFSRKNTPQKRKMNSLWTPRNITPINGSCYEVINSSISQEIF